MEIGELLELTAKRDASDLHLVVGLPPVIRVYSELQFLPNLPALTEADAERLIFGLLNPEQKEGVMINRELDFSFPFGGGRFKNNSRFRVNIYYQKNTLAASLRFISGDVKTLEQLKLPSSLREFSRLKQGFVLVTGPAGQGKTTTIAALIDEINRARNCHIVTIEDPIEYTYPKGKSLISQREMRVDTHSWDIALRSVLREDPDVVLIGEMRDLETVASALTIAETGHLVFASLHTNSCAQTIDRIVDVFPAHQQTQVRQQLSGALAGVVTQRLLPSLEGGLIPAVEILVATQAVKTTIREGKTHLIDNIIQTSKDVGMILLEEYLVELIKAGKVSLEQAEVFSIRPGELRRMMRK